MINIHMRAIEFLREYKNLEKEKANILKTISGLDAADENDKEILDRIYRLLHSEDMNTTLSAAFATPLSDESMPEKTKEQHRIALTNIIGKLDSDFNAMSTFIDKLEAGGDNGVIDIKALDKRVSSFNEVFKSDPVAMSAFIALEQYGTSKKQKGPGEYALAMLSDQIHLSTGTGDTVIKGLGQVEIKTEASSGGGRLGQSGLRRDEQVAIVEQHAEDIPSLFDAVNQGKSMGPSTFLKYLNVDLPLAGRQEGQDEDGNVIKGITPANAKKIRKGIVLKLLKPVFDEYATPMAAAFAQEDPTIAENEYGKQNFNWYKSKYQWDAFLIINYPLKKFVKIEDGDDLLNLRNERQVIGFGINIIGTSSGAERETFAQMKLGKAPVTK